MLTWYCAKFRLDSWAASGWQADTVFGHLCWGMKYLHGDERLAAFLADYCAGHPPLVISNGFPLDLLPRPLLGGGLSAVALTREQFKKNKDVKKDTYLALDEFNNAINGKEIGYATSFLALERVTLKNQLSRSTGTTGEEGTLFNFEEYHIPEISIYLKVEAGFVATAKTLFKYIASSGYGKRKSVGYGAVSLLSFEPFAGFRIPQKPNAFVSLSNFAPAKGDPVSGAWRTMVKYGKMGEEYASGGNAFKKPLLMFKAGSAFYTAQPGEYYGRLVPGLSEQYSQAVQYALALPVPLALPAPEA